VDLTHQVIERYDNEKKAKNWKTFKWNS
jgi:hypothetical protein